MADIYGGQEGHCRHCGHTAAAMAAAKLLLVRRTTTYLLRLTLWNAATIAAVVRPQYYSKLMRCASNLVVS